MNMQKTQKQSVKIQEEWKNALDNEFSKSYFEELKNTLRQEKKSFTVYPAGKNIFRAFDLTPLSQVKVVILGQDPYHGPNQAHGLSFSVQKGVRIPPSLRNIYQELSSDVNASTPQHGDLSEWAERGVLLLNAMLTVRAGNPGSHQQLGWQQFTDTVIQTVSNTCENCVFILWGNFARSKTGLIDRQKHLIIESAHPSPFAAHRGFFGSKPFSKANDYLIQHNKAPIDWQISE
jgi:uracil-DNA glycosylase